MLSLSNKAGALASKARRLAMAKINITGIAATSSPGRRVSLVLWTSNNNKAAKLV